ncbi:MAG: hypothetical protein GC168_10655 [Candidatus Hydrogenedens sp.]|nr:hypothetical protein [Candidatus Hydrogenedens sp.]
MVTLSNIEALRPTTAPASGSSLRRTDTPPEAPQDAASFSPESRAASELAKLLEQARQSEVRQQRVEEAKQNIREGTYKLQSVVTSVAARVAGAIA